MLNSKPVIKSQKGLILRFMREERKLSLPAAGKMLGMKASVIDHLENGNKPFEENEIEKFLLCYKFSKETFSDLIKENILSKHAANLYFLKNKN